MVACLIATAIPCSTMAQTDGGGKKKKKPLQTEQTSAKKQPNVKVSEPDGYINGHGYVDLGLPSGTKWATCNVGAKSPEKYGDYFAWGETSPKSEYRDDTWHHKPPYKIVDGVQRFIMDDYHALIKKRVCDQDGNLNSPFDAATSNWGSDWTIPNYVKIKELLGICSRKWISLHGVHGLYLQSPNGKSIFFPAGGHISGRDKCRFGKAAEYFSSNYKPHQENEGDSWVLGINITEDELTSSVEDWSLNWLFNDLGALIRPVVKD